MIPVCCPDPDSPTGCTGEHGAHQFPHSIGKTALVPWREYQRTAPTPKMVTAWGHEFGAGANWAVVTGAVSGVIVLDFDDWGDYRAWCMRYAARPAWWVESGSGRGCHVWCAYRDDVPSMEFCVDGQKLEIKSDGRIALLPGALHAAGETYSVHVADADEWPDDALRDLHDLFDQGYKPYRDDLLALPEAFVTDLLAARTAPAATTPPATVGSGAAAPTDLPGFQAALRGAGAGERHTALLSAAGHYARTVGDMRAYRDVMHLLAAQCDPPYGSTPDEAADLEGIIRAGWRYAAADPASDAAPDPFRPWDAVGGIERTWLVDGLLPDAALSILGGAPKAGKSTLARELAVAVATGGTWLGHAVPTPGAVLYVVGYGEGRLATIGEALRNLGAPAGNPLLAVGAPDLEAAVRRHSPRLIVLDTLGKAVMGKDTQDYAAMAQALSPIARLAQESGACILALHHTSKHADQSDPVGALLGSQQIAGTADTILTLRRDNQRRILAGVGREVGDLDALALDYVDGRYVVAGGADALQAEERMGEILAAVEGGTTRPADLAEALEVPRRTLQRDLAALVRDGRLVRAGGSRGMQYSLPG